MARWKVVGPRGDLGQPRGIDLQGQDKSPRDCYQIWKWLYNSRGMTVDDSQIHLENDGWLGQAIRDLEDSVV
jgi:hypothetical protein